MSARAIKRTALLLLAASPAALALAPAPASAQSAPAAGLTGLRYDLAGRQTGAISPDPDGAGPLPFPATRNTYNDSGWLVKVERGTLAAWQSEAVQPSQWPGFSLIQSVETLHDSAGRKLRDTMRGSDNAVHGVTQYSYDAAGRLECTAVRMNPAAWGSLPASACTLGPEGSQGPDRITKNVYDAASRVTEVWNGVGQPIARREAAYSFTPNGQRASLTDARGFRAEMTYDPWDRQKRWIFPSKTTAGMPETPSVSSAGDYEEYGYDSAGNRTSLRKRDGSVLTYQYDALNRMTAKIVPERAGLAAAHTRDVHYEYDLRGLQTRARFDHIGGEGITNVYDAFGRLVSSSSDMGGVSRTVGNLYDAAGGRIRITHPDGAYFTYDLDGLGRPTWVRENGGAPVTVFDYDSAGRRSTSAWRMTSYAYDPAGRLQTLSHNPAGTDRDQSLGFAYNPAGQIVTRSASNDSYAWTGAVDTSRPYAVNGLNQYTSAGPATFGYDPNGNLASTVNAPHSTTYVYDVENRLVSASGSHNAELVYDPLGRLWQVSSGASVRRLVYDGDALIAEYDAGGGMPHRYIHGNDPGVDDPLVWYHNAVYGWRQVLFHDHQGSIVGVTDMYHNPIAANSYDPWGIPGPNNAGRFGYTGQAWVPELGLWYYKARFYSPTTGRFLQVDPIGYADQVNLYAYVGNDPVNANDPSGAFKCYRTSYGQHCVSDGTFIDNIAVLVYKFMVEAGMISMAESDEPVRSDRPPGPDGKRGSTGGPGAGKDFPRESAETRQSKDGVPCNYCDEETTNEYGHPNSRERDHIDPKVRGGNNTPENERDSCRTCNRSKGSKELEEWLDWRRKQNEEIERLRRPHPR